VHRIIYVMVYGDVLSTVDEVDHEDLNNCNNKLCNLRKATHQENKYNKNAQSNSLTGLKGIGMLASGKYRVRVSGIHIGCFNTLEEAVSAVNDATMKLHGEFGRLIQ
jgi:hypothetical protein